MSNKDLVKITDNGNGEASYLPTRQQEEYGWPSLHREMSEWMRQWDRLFDGLFDRAYGLTPSRGMVSGVERGWGGFMPAVNVTETNNGVQVTAELPGVDEKNVEVSINRGLLTIKGEKKQESEEKKEGFYRMERSYGTFHRSIPLPQEVDTDQATATFKNGVLTVALPRLPELQSGAKKIAIKTEEAGK